MNILKISAKSSPNSIAGALTGIIKEQGQAYMQAVGAGAINQAVKAVAIARGFVTVQGNDIYCTPTFTTIDIDGEEKTGIKFHVGLR